MHCRLPSPATRIPAAGRGYASMCVHVDRSSEQTNAMSCLASACSLRTHDRLGLPAVTFVDERLPSDVSSFLEDRLNVHIVRLPETYYVN